MTFRSDDLPSAFFVLSCALAACAREPGTATTGDPSSSSSTGTPASSSESSTGDATSSSDDAATSSHHDGSGGSESTGVDASSSGGGPPPSMYGTYALDGGSATIDPRGCTRDQGGGGDWTIELAEPAEDGSSTLHEMYGPYENDFACTSETGGVHCSSVVTVDYAAMGGADAIVQLASSYDATWTDAATIAGEYDVVFSCEGSECADVRSQWSVAGFPCALAVSFTGTQT